MNYQSAFSKMLVQKGVDILDDNFVVCSFLADYIGSSFIDLQLLKAYVHLNRENILYRSISGYPLLEAKNHIKDLIKKSDKTFTVEQYIHSVEPVLFYLYPNEYIHYQTKNNTNGASIKISHPSSTIKKKRITIYKNDSIFVDPIPKQKKIVQPSFSSLSVNAVCSSLIITHGESDELRILKDRKDVTSSITSTVKRNTKRINIYDRGHGYIIELPKRKYEHLRCNYLGKGLSITSHKDKMLNFKEIALASMKGDTAVIANCESIYITQNKGTVLFEGKMNQLHLKKDKTKVNCVFAHKDVQKQLFILAHKAMVKGEFTGYKIKPKVSCLFGRTRRIRGTYNIGKEKLHVDISTVRGDIYIK